MLSKNNSLKKEEQFGIFKEKANDLNYWVSELKLPWKFIHNSCNNAPLFLFRCLATEHLMSVAPQIRHNSSQKRKTKIKIMPGTNWKLLAIWSITARQVYVTLYVEEEDRPEDE